MKNDHEDARPAAKGSRLRISSRTVMPFPRHRIAQMGELHAHWPFCCAARTR
jgi:hypothetical protein